MAGIRRPCPSLSGAALLCILFGYYFPPVLQENRKVSSIASAAWSSTRKYQIVSILACQKPTCKFRQLPSAGCKRCISLGTTGRLIVQGIVRMWNNSIGCLIAGAGIVSYDGKPLRSLGTMFEIIEKTGQFQPSPLLSVRLKQIL